MQKVEIEIPEDEKDDSMAIEESGAVEIDISGKKTEEEFKAEQEAEQEAEKVEVEVVDDTPKADRGRKPSEPPSDVTDEELEDYSDKVRKRIQHFSKGYHDERRAKEEALRERQELERATQTLMAENEKLKGNANKNQAALITQAKKTATIESEAARRGYKEAYESGDADAIIEAQEKLTSAKVKADRISLLKIPTLQPAKTPVQKEIPQTAPAVQVDDRAVDWQKQNQWFGPNDEMTSLALGLHSKLTKQGVSPQSDEYYESIDSRMRQVFPEEFEGVEPKRKRTSQVVAPATRSTAPRKITLTRSQVQIARRLGLTPEKYAQQVAIDMRKNDG